jgi:acyl-CoA hydrolase
MNDTIDRRNVVMRFLAEPTDINFGGKVHGGAVMKWIDQAGYAAASLWSGNYCVTVYVGGIRFYKPIHIGHMVEVRAQLIYTGRTSMHIAVDVWSADPRAGAYQQTTHCVIVFVAVDESGNPLPVPTWTPIDDGSRRLYDYAVRLMDLRKGIEQQMESFMPGIGT